MQRLQRKRIGADLVRGFALLVIYCQENCWMSWNAAKRVLSYGYPNVAWYPEGTEGWERANLPVAEAQPEPRADEERASPR